jgi:hypothetical protein
MSAPPKSIWQREVFPEIFIFRWPRQFIRWLFSWRGVRRILIVLAWTATAVALIYGEENWRGSHAWNQYRRELEARGEKVDFQEFIPKPVPDEQNFAATPIVQSWFSTNYSDWPDSYMQAAYLVSDSKAREHARGYRHYLDLVAWRMAFEHVSTHPGKEADQPSFSTDKLDRESRRAAAPAVLEALRTNDAMFAELRTASRRPYSRYPLVYNLDNPWGILLPHLSRIKGACDRLQLRASAELTEGQNAAAFDDVKLMWSLVDSLKGEPTLISCLERIVCARIAVQAVWEGLAQHAWSEAQLQELQSLLQQFNFLDEFKQSLAEERAAAMLTADLLVQRKYDFNMLGGSGMNDPRPSDFAVMIGRVAPRGWYQLEKLSYCRLQQLLFNGTFDPEKKIISPDRLESNTNELEQAFAGRKPFDTMAVKHQWLSILLLPGLKEVPAHIARGQIVADQAALACALERYRLANGHFPAQLEELAPKFIAALPHDVIGGEPYRYRRTEDGGFVLYSIGWNEKDDGGTPGKRLFDEKEGDWVW